MDVRFIRSGPVPTGITAAEVPVGRVFLWRGDSAVASTYIRTTHGALRLSDHYVCDLNAFSANGKAIPECYVKSAYLVVDPSEQA